MLLFHLLSLLLVSLLGLLLPGRVRLLLLKSLVFLILLLLQFLVILILPLLEFLLLLLIPLVALRIPGVRSIRLRRWRQVSRVHNIPGTIISSRVVACTWLSRPVVARGRVAIRFTPIRSARFL